MQIFWGRDGATVREVADELNRKRELAYTTVLTIVSRLWTRGLLSREPAGRGFRYRAAKTREEFLGDLSDQLIDSLINDFGEVGISRLGARLGELEPAVEQRLRRARRKR